MEFKKGVSGYTDRTDNYVIENELTVTITLSEYRELVSCHAKSSDKYDKLNSENRDLKREIEKLKNEIAYLKDEFVDARRSKNETVDLEDESESEE